MSKTKISLLVLLVLILSASVYATSQVQYEDKALMLQELGLLKGGNAGFELDRAPKRVEAAVMLIRLLSKESEVLSGSYTHPFTDVPLWADKYIGYMFENGLTKGKSASLFGSNDLTDSKSYITFILRALDYNDSEGDFSWALSDEFAVQKGILKADELMSLKSRQFLRDDMVFLSYNTLATNMKDSDRNLAYKLVNAGVFSLESAKSLGVVELSAKDIVDMSPVLTDSIAYSKKPSESDSAINTEHIIWVDPSKVIGADSVKIFDVKTFEKVRMSYLKEPAYKSLRAGVYINNLANADQYIYIVFDKDMNVLGHVYVDGKTVFNSDFSKLRIEFKASEYMSGLYQKAGTGFNPIIKMNGSLVETIHYLGSGSDSGPTKFNANSILYVECGPFYMKNQNYTVDVELLNPIFTSWNYLFIK